MIRQKRILRNLPLFLTLFFFLNRAELATPLDNTIVKVHNLAVRIVDGTFNTDGLKIQDGAIESKRRYFEDFDFLPLEKYLERKGNEKDEIAKLIELIRKKGKFVLSLAAGKAKVDYEIAKNRPDFGVVATDTYNPEITIKEYRKPAELWEAKLLKPQTDPLPNLVALRAEPSILWYLPEHSIDSILLINPFGGGLKTIFSFLEETNNFSKLKIGGKVFFTTPSKSNLISKFILRTIGKPAFRKKSFSQYPEKSYVAVDKKRFFFKSIGHILFGVNVSITTVKEYPSSRPIYEWAYFPLKVDNNEIPIFSSA